MSAAGAIFLKDLRVEMRSKQVINLYLILTVLILASFRFAFEVTDTVVDDLAAPILWVTLFFSGIFTLTPTYRREVEESTLDGVMLAPISPSSIFVGKLLSNLVIMFSMEVVAVLLFFAFFPVELEGEVLALLTVLVVGTIGFAVLGNLISAISANVARSELMLPVLLVPLLLFTIVVSAVSATAKVLEGAGLGDIGDELRLLSAFTVIYFAVGYLLVEYILEA